MTIFRLWCRIAYIFRQVLISRNVSTFLLFVEQFHWRYRHLNWKNTDKWLITCFKSNLKIFHSNYLKFCSNLPVKFISLKRCLLFYQFLLSFLFKQLRMRKFTCLLFVLKRSYIHYYIVCMTAPLSQQKQECDENFL